MAFVFILTTPDYDGVHIEACFSSKEKAIDAIVHFDPTLTSEDIIEFEIDSPLPEKFEKFYCHYLFGPSGDKLDTLVKMLRPSKTPSFEYEHPYMYSKNSWVIGYGKTPEQAESNAKDGFSKKDPIWQIFQNNREIQHAHPSTLFQSPKPYAIHRDKNVALTAMQKFKSTGEISLGLHV